MIVEKKLTIGFWVVVVAVGILHIYIYLVVYKMNKIEERIMFASSAIRENHIEEYRLKLELKKLLKEFEDEV